MLEGAPSESTGSMLSSKFSTPSRWFLTKLLFFDDYPNSEGLIELLLDYSLLKPLLFPGLYPIPSLLLLIPLSISFWIFSSWKSISNFMSPRYARLSTRDVYSTLIWFSFCWISYSLDSLDWFNFILEAYVGSPVSSKDCYCTCGSKFLAAS